MLFQRSRIAALLAQLATEHHLFIGTMSWKYPGWCGILYDEDRYFWGNHFSKARFNRNCLDEYSQVFKSVCVDATYHRIPTYDFLDDIASRVPDDFRFSFKVPEEITIKKFPDIESFGKRRGRENEHFLSHGLFEFGFLRHLERIRPVTGMLIFEFSHFHADDFVHGREFVLALDEFFAEAPQGWHYGVEVRNGNFLHPDYFDMLSRHGITHIYNQWTRMPPVTEQIRLLPPGKNTSVAARYLLTPKRSVNWAEREFAPYNQLRELDPAARESMRLLVEHVLSRDSPATTPSYLYISNQLEGNALHTIADVLENELASTPKS